MLLLRGKLSPQAAQGQLLEAGTGAPVEGALVTLVAEAGGEVDADLTNGSGRFRLRSPLPGQSTLTAERIGNETVSSDLFDLTRNQIFGIRLETSQKAVALEELRVEATQQCIVRPEEGLRLAEIWDEARKALKLQEWTERENLFRYRISRWVREMDPDARLVRSESRRTNTVVADLPVRSLPADELMRGASSDSSMTGPGNISGWTPPFSFPTSSWTPIASDSGRATMTPP